MLVDTHEYPLKMVELTHYTLSVKTKDPDVPETFWEAMRLPDWEAAINKERGKFEQLPKRGTLYRTTFSPHDVALQYKD